MADDDSSSSGYNTGTDSDSEPGQEVHRASVNVWDLPSDTNTTKNQSNILQNVHQSHSTGYIKQKQQNKPNAFQAYTNPTPPKINNPPPNIHNPQPQINTPQPTTNKSQPNLNHNNYAHTPPPPQYHPANNAQLPYNSNQINQQQSSPLPAKKAFPIQPSQTMTLPQQQMAYVQQSNSNQNFNNNSNQFNNNGSNQNLINNQQFNNNSNRNLNNFNNSNQNFNNSNQNFNANRNLNNSNQNFNNSNQFNNNNSNGFNNQYLRTEQKFNKHMYSNSTPNVFQQNMNQNYNQNRNAFTPTTQNNTQPTFNQWQRNKNNKNNNNNNNRMKADNVKQQWLNSQKRNGNNNGNVTNNNGSNNYLQKTLKAGYMQKEGGFVKSWKKRYFILRINGLMSYYEDDKAKKQIGIIDCNKVKKVNMESWGKKYFGLKLKTKERDWKFVCTNGTDRREWYDAFTGIFMMKM